MNFKSNGIDWGHKMESDLELLQLSLKSYQWALTQDRVEWTLLPWRWQIFTREISQLPGRILPIPEMEATLQLSIRSNGLILTVFAIKSQHLRLIRGILIITLGTEPTLWTLEPLTHIQVWESPNTLLAGIDFTFNMTIVGRLLILALLPSLIAILTYLAVEYLQMACSLSMVMSGTELEPRMESAWRTLSKETQFAPQQLPISKLIVDLKAWALQPIQQLISTLKIYPSPGLRIHLLMEVIFPTIIKLNGSIKTLILTTCRQIHLI